jgi:hypothetical protein
MSDFKNEDNLAIPDEETSRELINSIRDMNQQEKKFEEQINEVKKLLNQKSELIDARRDLLKKLTVYNVSIANVESFDGHSFTSLKEAREFRDSLVTVGIDANDVEIELCSFWHNNFEQIDGHKKPELYGYLYDPEVICKEYTCRINQNKKQKLSDDK